MSDICTCHPDEPNKHRILGHPGAREADFPVPWDFRGHSRPDSPWEIPVGLCTVSGCGQIAAVYNWEFESWSWPQVCSNHSQSRCTGCGTGRDDGLGSAGCGDCLPQTCSTCGGINHIATDRMCSCWVSLEDMAPADVKAIFAEDGTFNVGIDGRLTVA